MSEILSMGATPYPGMNRDRLFAFLKDRNVMEKGHEWPSSIYHIMKSCWEYSSADRPNFETICAMLTQVLDEKKEVT